MGSQGLFEGVEQRSLTIGGQHTALPIFYRDAGALIAVFPARMAALREALPSTRFETARLAPGLGAIGLACFEYRDSDVGVYNEVAVSIMLNDRRRGANVAGRALARNMRHGEFDVFVHHLPVTTELAREAGIRFWNYPKFIADIEFGAEPDAILCTLSQQGERIFTLRGAAIATPRVGERWFHTFTWMDGRPQRGDISINAHMLGISQPLGAATVDPGPHPIGRELSSMLISKRSIHYQRMPQYEAILHPPAVLSPTLLQRLESDEAETVAAGT